MSAIRTIGIGGDHAGFEYKSQVCALAKTFKVHFMDFGPFSDESVDYPDFVHPLCKSILAKEVSLGILICGSGNGVAITANKYPEIRAALCWEENLASLARQHNDANVLCLPARFISFDKAKAIIEAFLNTKFEGGRHQNRVNKINPC